VPQLSPEALLTLKTLFVHYCGTDRYRGSYSLSLTRYVICTDFVSRTEPLVRIIISGYR
jgi:hypothetical protein